MLQQTLLEVPLLDVQHKSIEHARSPRLRTLFYPCAHPHAFPPRAQKQQAVQPAELVVL